MSKGSHLGEFEILVLAALMRLGEGAYGVAIRNEIEARAAREASIGAVYATLERLEAKALITSRLGEATAARGGRAKKYFNLTAEGQARFQASMERLRTMTVGLVEW